MSFKYGQNRDEDEDGYQIIGTPFPPLDADEIVSRRPEIDQTVRDERGRRRFHGAFTGGFSAGYWNTVGSAEGFTPKIFKSSRKDKYDRNQLASKPEDYMDDEDFGSFGIAPKKIHTKDDYVENFTVSSLKDSQMTFDEVIRSVFQPSKESIGKRLYRKMKRLAKLDENLHMDQDFSEKNQTDQPIQSNNVQATKTNRHGLGYSGMLNTDEVYNESKYSNRSDKNAVITTMKSGRRLQITGEAFGYGALEEDDAMDIYGTDDISQYDFEIGSKVARKPAPVKKSITNNQNIRIQIEGFQICRGSFNLFADVKRKYRPPELPSNWKPPKRKRTETSGENKKSRWDTDRKSDSGQSEKNPEQPEQSKPISKQKVMNSNLRAIILGENIVHKSGIVTKTPNKDDKKELEFSKEIAKPVANVVPTMKTPLSGYFASKFTRSSTTSSHTLAGDKPLSAGLNTYQTMSSLSADERRKNELNDAQNDDDKPPIRSVYEWHPHKILCKRFGVQNPYPQFTDIVGIVCMNQSDKSRNMVVRLNATANNGGGGQSTKPPLFANLFEDLNQPQTMSEPEAPKSEPQKPQPKLVDLNEDDDEEEEEEARPPPPKPPIDLFKSIFESDEEEDDEDRGKQVQSTSSTNEEQSNLLKNKDDVMMIRNDVKSTKNYGIFSGIDFDQLEQESFELSNAATANVAINSNENPNKREDNYKDDDDEEDYYGPALPPTNSQSLGEANRLDNQYIGIKKTEKSSNKSKKKKRKKSKKMKIEKSANKKDKKRKRKKTKRSRRRSSSSSSTKSSDSSQETSSTSDNETNKLDDDGHVKDKIVELIKKVKHYKQHSNHHD